MKGDYRSLKSENVHVVAGLLMLFFKQLTTNIIPSDVLDYLSLELGASIRFKIKSMANDIVIAKKFGCLQILHIYRNYVNACRSWTIRITKRSNI